MPLTATEHPPEIDAMGVRFTMRNFRGPVRCHVMRSTLDHLGNRQARSDADALERFARNRLQFEAVASDLYDGGHRTPWISAEHLFAGLPPPDAD